MKAYHKRLSHGYRWINAYLKRYYGVIWSNNHVHHCCKYAGNISKGKHYKYNRTGQEKEKYNNLINNSWRTLSRPLEVIVYNMMSFYSKGKYY